jgi:hypothetical protein
MAAGDLFCLARQTRRWGIVALPVYVSAAVGDTCLARLALLP